MHPKETVSENPPGGKFFFSALGMDACRKDVAGCFFQIVTWQILGKSSLISEQPLFKFNGDFSCNSLKMT